MKILLFTLLLTSSALAATLPTTLQLRDIAAVSPNGTCGMDRAGENNGFTCPTDSPCCSSFGYCGANSTYCLTSQGCQTGYSATAAACTAPQEGTTISPDGTCGKTGDGKFGYRCPATGQNCCSSFGYCGNTTSHCALDQGCQAAYGTCSAAGPASSGPPPSP